MGAVKCLSTDQIGGPHAQPSIRTAGDEVVAVCELHGRDDAPFVDAKAAGGFLELKKLRMGETQLSYDYCISKKSIYVEISQWPLLLLISENRIKLLAVKL